MVLLDRAKTTLVRMRELELAQYGLTRGQASIIHTIHVAGGSATAQEIANTIVRQYHSVVSIVSRMEKAGLVKRKKLKGMKTYTISITKEGWEKFEQLPGKSVKMFFEDLSPEEKRQLAVILQKTLNKGRRLLGLDVTLSFLEENTD